MTDSLHFQVDLKGLIRILSDNLYSSDDVFLRELLQNAIDAIEARKLYTPNSFFGHIHVKVETSKEGTMLEFYDNVIGLTNSDLHEFLSVIGQSSKRGIETRGNYIGQFGIGLLSCFLLTSQIEVISKSIKEEGTHRWVGKNNGKYDVSEAEEEMDAPGTRLMLSPQASSEFQSEDIIQYLKLYGYLVETPIVFEDENGTTAINDNFIPFRQTEDASREQLQQFGQQ